MRDRPGPGRWVAPLVLAVAADPVLLVLTASAVSAHAASVSSQPEPGAVLASAPGVVRLRSPSR